MTKVLTLLHKFEAEEIRRNALTLQQKATIDEEIDRLLDLISNSESFGDADKMLMEMGEIQGALARFAFKHGIELSLRQRSIVREFDRFDVPEVRKAVYQKIRNSEFPWQSSQGNS